MILRPYKEGTGAGTGIFAEMEIYRINRITEADYGCEDTDRIKPSAALILKNISSEEAVRSAEVAEEWISRNRISEGSMVCFTEAGDILKYIRVAAGVIHKEQDGTEKIFATAKGYGKYKGWWEFPGGKIEEGETPQEALRRELKEELAIDAEVCGLIHTIEYDYPEFHLSMDCFWCRIQNGDPQLLEAGDAKWLSGDELRSVNWLPADLELIDILERSDVRHRESLRLPDKI